MLQGCRAWPRRPITGLMTNEGAEPPTHAGGVVIEGSGTDVRVLLVRGSRAPYPWVLPKGHIERGETPEDAARREVQEEAGVDAEVSRDLGTVSFIVRGNRVVVQYFAMRK